MQEANPDHNRLKQLLRAEMRRAVRKQRGDSRRVCEALAALLDGHRECRSIAVYAAMPGEVDLEELVAGDPARCWVFPRICGDELRFHRIRSPQTELVRGAFGIREPLAGLDELPVGEIDAFLCPGLAFDSRGGRLGRGRGFYDRLLAAARPNALKVGVAFPWQIVPDTFMEAHDVPMDTVIC